jgi:hypothetical protein
LVDGTCDLIIRNISAEWDDMISLGTTRRQICSMSKRVAENQASHSRARDKFDDRREYIRQKRVSLNADIERILAKIETIMEIDA